MLNSFSQLIKFTFVGTFLCAFVVWNVLIAFTSRYKKVYALVYLLMGEESTRVNRKLGFIDTKEFPWYLAWYRNTLQVKGFIFKGSFVQSLPFTEIQKIYFRERTILIAITCLTLVAWIYAFSYLTSQI